jgi:hypothetical protein
LAISKRLRYEIFRRDKHACRYCGAKAPAVTLTIDHVTPKTLGGTDDPSNLVTACADCNSGKTSSSPDAPIVADVNADAVRWAAAIKAAQARMLADVKAREEAREQFAGWWDEWGYGTRYQESFPRPADWERTVDQLTAAGLPLRVLRDCISRAMSATKVRPEEKFRYMCGVAWKKVAELQKAARDMVAEESSSGEDEDDVQFSPAQHDARRELASEILGAFGDETYEWYLDDTRSQVGPDDPDVEEYSANRAVYHAAQAADALGELLAVLDGGPEWIAEATKLHTDISGLAFSDIAMHTAAARLGVRALKDRTAEST